MGNLLVEATEVSPQETEAYREIMSCSNPEGEQNEVSPQETEAYREIMSCSQSSEFGNPEGEQYQAWPETRTWRKAFRLAKVKEEVGP